MSTQKQVSSRVQTKNSLYLMTDCQDWCGGNCRLKLSHPHQKLLMQLKGKDIMFSIDFWTITLEIVKIWTFTNFIKTPGSRIMRICIMPYLTSTRFRKKSSNIHLLWIYSTSEYYSLSAKICSKWIIGCTSWIN